MLKNIHLHEVIYENITKICVERLFCFRFFVDAFVWNMNMIMLIYTFLALIWYINMLKWLKNEKYLNIAVKVDWIQVV